MTIAHNLGFPRIGKGRELKWALESYWRGESGEDALLDAARTLKQRHWRLQANAGLDQLPVGDFSLYDHVLDHSVMLGAVPARFGDFGGEIDLDTRFRMARGRAPRGKDADACEMTKWFDTNYHYIVPELVRNQQFRLSSHELFDDVELARQIHASPRPVLLGPLTWLWLGKVKGQAFDRLDLVDELLPVYADILERLDRQGVEWVQIDEPILVTDLPVSWRYAFETVYRHLAGRGPKVLLATYFGDLGDNLGLACSLPVDGLHIDASGATDRIAEAAEALAPTRILSAGVIDGRNVWRTDLAALLDELEPLRRRLGKRLWLAPSCSLLHVPVDLDLEDDLDRELSSWLAFAKQKITEVATLRAALDEGRSSVAAALDENTSALRARRASTRLHLGEVRERVAAITPGMAERRSNFATRRELQRRKLNLPLFPTTTIGSFPQTDDIRRARRDLKAGRIDRDAYLSKMQAQIDDAIRRQEALGLDVLVHGEPERNDMVEYFGEQLEGFAFTRKGWVQSYGSRCVKPPIIYGDVSRPAPITLDWIRYARSRTSRPVKGMLTGPVTILNWSFVRDDQPRSRTCAQIALAMRDEVLDLERAGIDIIQIDEAALREGLPLRQSRRDEYLRWAVGAFRLAANGVADETQIHTHMCYSEFNEIIDSIANMDADVITIETSRSDMELLDVFEGFRYPNDIGPGVYDIHSPAVPSVEWIVGLVKAAAARIPAERLWINPDCGLKTRGWPEVSDALTNMVEAARRLRSDYARSMS